MYYTYDDVLLLAAELVAIADNDQTSKDFAIDLCLQAGKLRGLVAAGEPINSEFMVGECEFGYDLHEMSRERHYVPA